MNFLLAIHLLLGWLSGWLVNYLVDVLPADRKLSQPTCQICQKTFNWPDYLLFRRCPNCGKRRNRRNLVLQAMMMLATALLWKFPNPSLPFSLSFILLIYLAVVLVIDLEHRLILHPVSAVGVLLGLGIGIFLRGSQSLAYGITSTLLGGATGFGIMLVFYLMGDFFVKRMSKKGSLPADEVALGFGDVTLSGILGLLLGWRAIFACLFFAILAGGLISLVIILKMLIAKKYKAFTAIPYAPFLIISAIYFLFF
jgi:leader peptidase (prepilin peptidase)/N-methyltransferase